MPDWACVDGGISILVSGGGLVLFSTNVAAPSGIPPQLAARVGKAIVPPPLSSLLLMSPMLLLMTVVPALPVV